ncbi:beta-L-arabinofuranosidase domain-containing protein [Bythopirellula goksoeyrii]|uniref:Non-reducing end beta-L-arabinofuranosidase n=1 Tax=Bythopirellula goksoeyrii TaxID=1400387 RepID=A0A5B9QAL8_9BACT|nr:beta-L-arabinofuranosidase domain-containing protein [Bythopirellula goksoeyrii]QEG33936.1 Non-reducing end beta-L-arabinofuranosidase [Bythopirellula goksoeyrii]
MIRITQVARLLLLALLSGTAHSAESKIEPVCERGPDTRISLSGPVNDYAQAVIDNWLMRVPRDNPAILEMFDDRDVKPYRDLLPWSGEFAGKYLTSLVEVLPISESDQLESLGADFVSQLVAKQAKDGYLGPFPKLSRLTGTNASGGKTWDAWGHYHVMLGLLEWYDYSGDESALNCASRIGDLFCDKFLKTGKKISSIGSAEMNQAVVHSLAILYQRTGETKYLDLAEEIVLDFSAPNAGNYLQAGLEGLEFYQIPKPRWESLHSLIGLAELYWITGNPDYREAFEHFWWSIVKLDRHNNGGFSSGEKAHGNPYHPGPIETCCTIAWMAMSTEMLKMTGDPLVADELELSTLNQAIALHSPSGNWSTYNTPMDGQRIPSTVDIAFQIRPGSKELNCCSVNAARSLGMIANWALLHQENGLVLNWYGPSRFEDKLRNIPISLEQFTNYPTEGEIDIELTPAQPIEFELKLRIPHWSTNSKVTVNGKEIAVKPGTYASIQREWKAGDKINIQLDMSLRYWAGEKEYAGKMSIYRGPLLLAYEEPFPSSLEFSEDWNAHGHFRSTNKAGAWVTYIFEGDNVEWHGFFFADAGKARVLIDDEEVEIVDQYGPISEVPFVWKREGLGSGRHELRLEVLAEKNAKSSNTWSNVREFKAAANLPKLSVKQLARKQPPNPVESGFLSISTKDTKGRDVQLRDYGSVGQGSVMYYSWIPTEGAEAIPFSRSNPSRTSRFATP